MNEFVKLHGSLREEKSESDFKAFSSCLILATCCDSLMIRFLSSSSLQLRCLSTKHLVFDHRLHAEGEHGKVSNGAIFNHMLMVIKLSGGGRK